MSKVNHRNILWTARDISLPKGIWDRLEEMGFRVIIVDALEDPLESIRKTSPSLWVAQTNGNPDQNLSVLRSIRSACPVLPIVLVSTEPSVDEAVRAVKLGVHDYIPKGASEERLWVTIEGALTHPTGIRDTRTEQTKNIKAFTTPIAFDPAMKKVMILAGKIANSRTTILIQGESGTGKEVLARFIHQRSDRKDGPFVAVNCAALPETLLESELFGHEKGAFTGAVARKKGKFELAHGGTLLLDEISETAASIQAKLLRVLQEREIDRVGGQYAVPVDTRVIATTNRDLEAETQKGHFRLDLFYRLNVVPLHLPPLRERIDDIFPLANFFLERHCTLNGIPVKRMTPDVETFLKQRRWPGNVRELENLMERTTLLVDSDTVVQEDLAAMILTEEPVESERLGNHGVIPLRDMERRMIFSALDNHRGNRTHAAKVLGISVRTLRNKLNEYQGEMKPEFLLPGAEKQDRQIPDGHPEHPS